MKLSEIETKYEENDYGFTLYDAEQMQEYAKECVREAYKEIVKNSYVSDGRVEQAGNSVTVPVIYEIARRFE